MCTSVDPTGALLSFLGEGPAPVEAPGAMVPEEFAALLGTMSQPQCSSLGVASASPADAEGSETLDESAEDSSALPAQEPATEGWISWGYVTGLVQTVPIEVPPPMAEGTSHDETAELPLKVSAPSIYAHLDPGEGTPGKVIEQRLYAPSNAENCSEAAPRPALAAQSRPDGAVDTLARSLQPSGARLPSLDTFQPLATKLVPAQAAPAPDTRGEMDWPMERLLPRVVETKPSVTTPEAPAVTTAPGDAAPSAETQGLTSEQSEVTPPPITAAKSLDVSPLTAHSPAAHVSAPAPEPSKPQSVATVQAVVLEKFQALTALSDSQQPTHVDVELKLEGNEHLHVRMDMVGAEVQVKFSGGSAELMNALEQAWPMHREEAARQGVLVAEAQFSSGTSGSSSSSSERDGANREHPSRMMEEYALDSFYDRKVPRGKTRGNFPLQDQSSLWA